MPTKLIQELNAEHAALVKALKTIASDKAASPAALSPAARALLPKIRLALTKHLEKEEAAFYPPMRRAAETNPSLKELLRVMGAEMDEIASRALALLDTWIAGGGAASFSADFDSLLATLGARIQREEHQLYARYLKLAAGE